MFGLGFGAKPFGSGIRPLQPGQPPLTPGNFQATAGDALINLSWDASSGATGYEVAVGTSTDPTNWFDIGNVTSYELGGLVNATAYYVRVRAINGRGASTPTSSLERTPANSSGYSQMDADAGWRFPGNTLNQNNTQYNRAWLGNPEQYTRAIRGIYKNTSNYNATYINFTATGQPARIRARIRESSSVTDAFVCFFRNEGASYNNLWSVEWYNDGFLALYSITGGTATQQASTSVSRSANSNYLFELLDNGSTITVRINGSTAITHNSTLYNTQRYIGISMWLGTNVSTDWLSVDQASAGVVVQSARGVSLSIGRAGQTRLAVQAARGVSVSTARASQARVVEQQARGQSTTAGRAVQARLVLQPARGVSMALAQAVQSRVAAQGARGLSLSLGRAQMVRYALQTARGQSVSLGRATQVRVLGQAGRGLSVALGRSQQARLVEMQAHGQSQTTGQAAYVRLVALGGLGISLALSQAEQARVVQQAAAGLSLSTAYAYAVLVGADYIVMQARGVSLGLGRAAQTRLAVQQARGQGMVTGQAQQVRMLEQAARGQSTTSGRTSYTRIALQSASGLSLGIGQASAVRVAVQAATGVGAGYGYGVALRVVEQQARGYSFSIGFAAIAPNITWLIADMQVGPAYAVTLTADGSHSLSLSVGLGYAGNMRAILSHTGEVEVRLAYDVEVEDV